MDEMTYNSISLTALAPSLAAIFGVETPAQAQTPTELLTKTFGKAEKLVLFHPDAVGLEQYQKHTDLYGPVLRHTKVCVPFRTVMPSVTPVCFGTMFTGVLPEVHGITSYRKPVIKTDCLYDAAIRAGKKCAIIADRECSMGKIWLERDMDYIYYDEDPYEGTRLGLEAIRSGKYDLISIYEGNFDSVMHKFGPESPEALRELQQNMDAFDRIANAVSGGKTLLGFCPDHGCHTIDGGCGSHGLEQPSDLNILHFFGMK